MKFSRLRQNKERERKRENRVQYGYRNWLRVPNINQRNQNRSR